MNEQNNISTSNEEEQDIQSVKTAVTEKTIQILKKAQKVVSGAIVVTAGLLVYLRKNRK